MQQVIKKLISNISKTPQDFHLNPEMLGGEERTPAPSPANGGGKSSQRRRKKHASEHNHWIRKKVEKLSVQLRPVPVKPLLLDIGAHKSLLVRLGLWDFLNFRFDGEIRREMLTELVASYKYHREQYKGMGYVHGLGISLSRAAVANALHLPVEKINEKARQVLVSESEDLFIQKLFWDWIILMDDGDDKKMKYVSTFAKELKKSRFETADWAGLIWFMVERELKKGENLVKCHYSSHLQALLKHQRPELFEDDQGGEVVGSPDKNSGKEIADVGDGVESGLNASLLIKCCKRERKFLDKDVVGVDDEEDRSRKLHCSDLAGREFGGDYMVIEGGNLEGVCQSDNVDSLEKNEEFLLHLQDQPQPEKIGESSTDFAGGKVVHLVVDLDCFAGVEFRDDDQLKDSGILEEVCPSNVVDSLENRVKVLPNLQGKVNKEIPASDCEMEDEVNETEYKTSTLEEGDVIQSEANEVVKEDEENEEECGVKEVKESEASFEAEVGNSLDVRSPEDKEIESPVIWEAKLVQDQHQPELRLENSTEENGESLADLAGGEVDRLEVDLSCTRVDAGRDVHSAASVDLIAQEVQDREVNKEGSTDDFACQEIEKHPVDTGDDSMATLVNQPRKAKLGDLLGDKELHLFQDQHQPELELENAAVENGESLEYQPVNMGSCRDNSGKEFVLEISKEDGEHLFLPKIVEELFDGGMETGGTVDAAMATLGNHTREAKIGNSFRDEEMEFDKVQDQHQPEIELEKATEKNAESLADFAGGEVNCLVVDLNCMGDNTGKGVDSVVSADLFAEEVNDKEAKREGSSDGLVCQEVDNHPVVMEEDAVATLLTQDQNQPEPGLENATEGNRENFADLAGGKVVRQGTGRDVDSVVSADLFAQEVGCKEAKMEGSTSTDGLVCQKLENQLVDMEYDAVANLVNPAREANIGDLIGDKQQKLHMVQDQHQPELGLENATEENGESLENQNVDISGKEFVLEISKEEDEHLFLQKKVDVEMDSGGTEDDAMVTVVNQTSELKLGDEEKMKFPKIQEHQSELELDNAFKNRGESLGDFAGGEVNCLVLDLNRMGDNAGNEVDSIISADLLAEVVHDKEAKKECSTDGLVCQEIENQPVDMEDDAVATLLLQEHQSELELDNASEKSGESLGDFAGGEVNCLVVDLNYMGDNAGNKVDPIVSVDLLAEVVHDKEAKKECSTDGLVCQEIENQPVDMEDNAVATLLPQDQDQPELGLEIATEKNGEGLADFAGKEGSTGDLVFQEIENLTVDAGSCQDNSGKDVALEEISDQEEDEQLLLPKKVDELFDMEIDSGGTNLQLTQTQSNKEDEAMPTLVNQAPEGSIDKAQIVLSDEECQSPFQHLETDEGKIDMLLQSNGNASRSYTSLGQFPFDTDMAGYSFVIPTQYGQDADTDNMVGTSEEHAGCSFGIPAQHGQEADHVEESMDLDICGEKMKSSIARFMELARSKVEEKHISNSKLQKKIGEQNHIIQQYDLLLQKETRQNHQNELTLKMEQQQKQKSDRKYERELYLMQKVLEDYRKAIKVTNNSIAKYRERTQFPEEPLYTPHSDGGGEVILVSEWKKLKKERQEMATKAMLEEFEEVMMKNMKELLSVLETYCDRLGDLEQSVQTMRGRF